MIPGFRNRGSSRTIVPLSRPSRQRLSMTGEVADGGCAVQGGSHRLLTPAEVAEWLKVSEVTIKNKYRLWGLRPQKVGRLLRFRERDVLAYLESKYG
ncbi:helix-turn-helix domain-containing protein [Streptomyces sp. NPDC048717]|uniref:helix-turn-helix domain-containing protein n=1 Tax=Streptomyces sp. NPDC048717 TaxID=3154928 RepID=UPI003444922C